MIADVEVRSARNKGLGVFARRDFEQGEFIFRRRHGRTVANSEVGTLSEEERKHRREVSLESVAGILPPGCSLNHSCDPNAMPSGVKVFAWRRIAAGDERTIDYRLDACDEDDTWDCRCGSTSCTGVVIGSFFTLDGRPPAGVRPVRPELHPP